MQEPFVMLHAGSVVHTFRMDAAAVWVRHLQVCIRRREALSPFAAALVGSLVSEAPQPA
jgi:hypothetical protein